METRDLSNLRITKITRQDGGVFITAVPEEHLNQELKRGIVICVSEFPDRGTKVSVDQFDQSIPQRVGGAAIFWASEHHDSEATFVLDRNLNGWPVPNISDEAIQLLIETTRSGVRRFATWRDSNETNSGEENGTIMKDELIHRDRRSADKLLQESLNSLS